MADTSDADWGEYYRKLQGRPPRELALEAVGYARAPGFAVDLGCGDGTETVFLLEQGWTVEAVDLEPAAVELTRERAAASGAVTVHQANLAQYQPPAADLVLGCVSLPFVAPEWFGPLWARLRNALSPSGLLAVQLFGDQDSWASGDSAVGGMTFHARHQVEGLLDGLEVLTLNEKEFDGPSGRGPKHWHRFDIIARAQ